LARFEIKIASYLRLKKIIIYFVSSALWAWIRPENVIKPRPNLARRP